MPRVLYCGIDESAPLPSEWTKPTKPTRPSRPTKPPESAGAPADETGGPADETGASGYASGAPADETGALADETGAPVDETGALADETGGPPRLASSCLCSASTDIYIAYGCSGGWDVPGELLEIELPTSADGALQPVSK